MLNEVRLMGRLAKDPKLVEFQNGGSVCNLRIITSRSWKDQKTGDFREEIEGHSVVVQVPFIAKRAAETLKKGSLVYIAGALRTRKWIGDNDVTRYTTEIIIRQNAGTLRRLPTNVGSPSSGQTNTDTSAEDIEIDYMAEMSGLDTVSLNGDSADPFV